ncbi:PREDICTED: uncharacterized protein LOC109393622 [Hipposideros armiger]|uniref:Uncharacterized protein LOC109393622 n=1 Tax=Hipposideros armiger TaxID=186990 RepID=A0A8B7T223_HIPAR|nr:PREDICTED: uncharacterized protein LOC109393622 [Hipposideros armiger]
MQRISSSIHLTLFWAGATAALVLVPQDQAVTVSVGESATFRCSMEGGTFTNYYYNWYRKTQDSTMAFIYRDGGLYGPGFQNRFRSQIDASDNQAVLEILKASEKDEGFYYCACDYHPAAGPLLSSSKTIEIHVEQQCQQDQNFLLNKSFKRRLAFLPFLQAPSLMSSPCVPMVVREAWPSMGQERGEIEPKSGVVAFTIRFISCGEWLIFGKGTYLTVEPKSQPPAKPSVFIMKNKTSVACLVKDFYPKDVNIQLQSSKKIIEFDPAIVVSPSGKYSAVKLGKYNDSNSVTCSVQHNNEILYSTNFEARMNSSDNLKPPVKTENIQQTSESCPELKVHAGKLNMMSLTVLGLRMLLAKSVAVNFLLTAKLFFF